MNLLHGHVLAVVPHISSSALHCVDCCSFKIDYAQLSLASPSTVLVVAKHDSVFPEAYFTTLVSNIFWLPNFLGGRET